MAILEHTCRSFHEIVAVCHFQKTRFEVFLHRRKLRKAFVNSRNRRIRFLFNQSIFFERFERHGNFGKHAFHLGRGIALVDDGDIGSVFILAEDMLVSISVFNFKRFLRSISKIKANNYTLCREFFHSARIKISKSTKLFEFLLGLFQLDFGIFLVRNKRLDFFDKRYTASTFRRRRYTLAHFIRNDFHRLLHARNSALGTIDSSTGSSL